MFKTDDEPGPFKNQITSRGRTSNDPLDRLQTGDGPTAAAPVHELDSDRAKNLYSLLMGHYRRELERQGENRHEQGIDEDYYDNEQWTEDAKAALLDRGQQPLVFNVIATTIDWMLGTEKRGRTDYRILPRLERGSESAERKTQLLKYLADVNRAEFAVSEAFASTVKAGVGWLECGLQSDDEGEIIYDRFESWRNVLFDSMAQEKDLSDARFIARVKWTDTDIAKAMFPGREDTIDRAAQTSFDLMRSLDGAGDEQMDAAEEEWSQTYIYGVDNEVSERDRVRLIEMWFRTPVEDDYVAGGQFSGEVFDPKSPGHRDEIALGYASTVRKVRMRTHVAILTEAGLLFLARSPYRHNRYPFTPIWCYRRGRNGLPYGVIRRMRDPQSDINKRASKALHILNTNKVIMDEGAVDDLDEFQEEAARPDAIIVKKPGKHLELGVDRDLAPAHLDLMSRSIEMIQSMSGITDENLGRTTNATSGKAIIARQDQGALATASIFDNLRFARQVHGSKMLSLIEQYFSDEKQFRITDMRGNARYEAVNDGLPENDITRSKADFIISEDDWNATLRQSQVEQLVAMMSEIGKANPEIMMASLDLIVELMDVPMREELVKRIRQATGAEDPDADPNDPETQQRQAAKQRAQQMQERMAQAELAKVEGEAAEKKATAAQKGAEVEKTLAQVREILANTAGSNVDTQVRALEAAAQIMQGASLAGVADTVLNEAGYEVAEPKGKPQPPPSRTQPPPGAEPAPQPQPEPAPVQGGPQTPQGGQT